MDSKDIKVVHDFCDDFQEKVTLDFISAGDEISDGIMETLEGVVASSTCLELKRKKDSDLDEPYIRIRGNIRFKARPHKKLLAMFLETLKSSIHPGPSIALMDVQDIIAPVFLKVYVAPFCPHCPIVVKEMVNLALASDLIRIDIIDGTLFTRKAEADGIMAAPTVICDDRHRWSGSVAAQEILDIILSRKPEDLSSHTLKTMIEAGNAARLGEMMVQECKVFPAIHELLTDDKWPVRLGAMVTVQAIHELAPDLSEEIVHALWDRIQELSDTVKGDVIYLTGEVASYGYREKLKAFLTSDSPDDLRESVEDALETMNERKVI